MTRIKKGFFSLSSEMIDTWSLIHALVVVGISVTQALVLKKMFADPRIASTRLKVRTWPLLLSLLWSLFLNNLKNKIRCWSTLNQRCPIWVPELFRNQSIITLYFPHFLTKGAIGNYGWPPLTWTKCNSCGILRLWTTLDSKEPWLPDRPLALYARMLLKLTQGEDRAMDRNIRRVSLNCFIL